MKLGYKQYLVLMLVGLLLSACAVPTTTSCPNCMNAKPVYYNKEKARDARKLARRADKHSAVGGNTLPDPYGVGSKDADRKKKKGSKTIELENEPIL